MWLIIRVSGLFTLNENMERLDLKLTEPRRKKCRAKRAKALPVPTKCNESDETELQSEIKICFGHLKDKSIFVNDLDEIKHLYLSVSTMIFYKSILFSTNVLITFRGFMERVCFQKVLLKLWNFIVPMNTVSWDRAPTKNNQSNFNNSSYWLYLKYVANKSFT